MTHGTMTFVCPGAVIEIVPPYVQTNCDVFVNAGYPPSKTFGLPGAHGAGVFGIQGIGVRTPSAAAVADATVGFAIDVHIPNGGIFTIGL